MDSDSPCHYELYSLHIMTFEGCTQGFVHTLLLGLEVHIVNAQVLQGSNELQHAGICNDVSG